jgi:ABC-type transporter Mla subunit MlaD
VLALLASGCGSSQSAQEKWANQVCEPIATWQNQIKELVSDAKAAVTSPSSGTIDTLKADAQKAVSATNTMTSDLRSLPPAPGSDGQTAKETVTTFASQMSQIVDSLKSNLSGVSSSTTATQAATALQAAAAQISSLLTQAKSTVSSLEATSSDLKSGFQDADSCNSLTGSS